MISRLNCKYRSLNSNQAALKTYLFSSTKKYILSQFPYPSGQLHLGHARVYYIGDTLARYYKLHNYKVIYPIGFDSFGLPAENAAIVHGKNPKTWTENNITQMKQQLNSLQIQFDWDREIATHTPEYYKWTQKIFLQMFQKGLAYKAESEVNWDPIDKTVLANEQVDNLGRSWRSGAIVQKKMLSQWFLKITHFAQQLQSDLASLEWIQRVKAMQAGWIGFQKGYSAQFQLFTLDEDQIKKHSELKNLFLNKKINVFLKDPSIMHSNFYIRLNIQTDENQKTSSKQKTVGWVVNPINKKHVQIKLGSEQNGIKFQAISIDEKIQKQLNSKQNEIQMKLNKIEIMRIKDWSISRQRYWGCPIPIIYCNKCGIVPVPEEKLPVVLPPWKGEGNPLVSSDFKKCRCPQCGSEDSQRETDTMDTFVDSSWYYLRFLDSNNLKDVCNPQKANFWMPVDIYIGGIQHAIMHLLYARFIMRVLANIGVCKIREPFKQLVVQGLVKGKAIRHKITGKYLKLDQVSSYPANELQQTYEKMSKSKFNGLNPQHLVNKFGTDALRMALFFAAPPQHDIDFHEDLLVSAQRFLKKVQELSKSLSTSNSSDLTESKQLKDKIVQFSSEHPAEAFSIKRIIQKLQTSIEKRFMHVYVANTMQLFNNVKQLLKNSKQISNSKLSHLLFDQIFIPVLLLIAPQTITKLNKRQKMNWPKSQFFISFKQYLIMKGSKLIKKGVIQCKANGDVPNQQEIVAQLQLPKDSVIKNNKKSIVILVK